MPTSPLPQSILDKMKSTTQSVRWFARFGPVRQFRAYCCNIDSDTIMGVSKEPVPIVDVTPNPVCLGNAIIADFTGSYAPGSSVTTRAIDFGDSTVIDPAGNTENHTYASAGTFTIEATVRETGGDEQTVQIQVIVEDCTETEFGAGVNDYIYAATYGEGVYYWDGDSWNDRGIWLEGTSRNVNYITQHPGTKHLPSESHRLFYATDGGIYRTSDGGRSGGQLVLPDPSNVEFADAPAATVDELTFHWVEYVFVDYWYPIDDYAIYVLAAKSSVNRQWMYKSTDDGLTWTSRGVVTV